MTTLWADGFEDTTVDNLNNDYTLVNVPTSAAGRRAGSNAIATTLNSRITRLVGGTSSTLFFSCAIYLTTYGSGTQSYFRLQEAGNTHVALAFVTGTGQLRVTRGNLTTTLFTTEGAPVPINTWIFLQVKVVISDTVGEVEVRDANGNVILHITGADTRNAGTGFVNEVSFGSSTGGSVGSIDDLHVWDATGSVCNTWTNDTRVDSLRPDGAGDSTQFTPSAGANWQCVDEQNASATDYVDSATAGHRDLYTASNLSHNPVSIFGVVRTAVASKDDAGVRSLSLATKSGSTVNVGASQALTLGSGVRLADVLDVDPNTSAAWTKAGLDAMQIGYEVV